jgi:hypothetical protein
MKPKFDVWDHFKGNFQGPKAQKEINSGAAIRAIQDAYMDSIIYGLGEIGYDIDGNPVRVPPKKIQMAGGHFNDVGEFIQNHNIFQKEIQGDFVKECEHEPIDVGFNHTKIVCKKCDKDL